MTIVTSHLLVLAFLLLGAAGCETTTPTPERRPVPVAKPMEYSSPDIRIGLVGALRAGDEGTLVEDPGWVEYVLAIENRGRRTLTVHNLKLLTMSGRYLDSAASFEQLSSPPDAASEIGANVAKRAAGQVIPYGGTIVGIIAGAVSASAAESDLSAKRDFDLRKLKAVELAPAGKVTGSAFLPNVTNAKALVVDYGHGKQRERIEIRFPRA